MNFDLKKFETTNFVDRTEEIEVPELKDFFDKKAKPVWKVRGMTGTEIAKMHDAVNRARDFEGILELIASGSSKDKIEGFKKALGISDDVPADFVRRVNMIKLASVDPDMSDKQELVVKLGEAFPVVFRTISDAIQRLSGQGKLGES
jgi:hypothetical protein